MNDKQRTWVDTVLSRERFDAVVASSPEATWYLSGAHIETQKSIPERVAAVVWVPGEDPTFIVCNLEENQARAESWIADICTYWEFRESPMAVLASVLRRRGLQAGRLGVELRHLSAAYFRELRSALPEAQWVAADEALGEVRMVKTDEEIHRLRRAALATDEAIWEAFLPARPGESERDVSIRLQTALLQKGCDRVEFAVVLAGRRTCLTHGRAGDYRMASGDVLRTDVGGSFGGYMSDLARTVVVGTATRRQRDIYAWLWEVHQELIDMMRPGTAVRELYERCRKRYERVGAWFGRPHIGHSLGLGLHDPPMINPYATVVLRPGMTMAIEPNYMLPGEEKYHLEDLVLVTERDPEVLSRTRPLGTLVTTPAD